MDSQGPLPKLPTITLTKNTRSNSVMKNSPGVLTPTMFGRGAQMNLDSEA